MVSTHSRPKAAGNACKTSKTKPCVFQHTAARRRLENICYLEESGLIVSTHSRPKAAGSSKQHNGHCLSCFNTQPPEGGWMFLNFGKSITGGFNTQPPEGGWRKRKGI